MKIKASDIAEEKAQTIDALEKRNVFLEVKTDAINEELEKKAERIERRKLVMEKLLNVLKATLKNPKSAHEYCHDLYAIARQQNLLIEELTENEYTMDKRIAEKDEKISKLHKAIEAVIIEIKDYDKLILNLNKCNYELNQHLDKFCGGDYSHRNLKEGEDSD